MAGPGFHNHLQKSRRYHVQDPAAKRCRSREVSRQGSDAGGFEVNDQALGHDQSIASGAADAREQSLTSGNIGEVEWNALQAANRFFAAKNALFFFQDGGKVHLDPAHVLRERHAIGAGVEPGSEIDNRVRAFFDRSQDSPVKEVSTKRLGPLSAGARHLAMNFFAAPAGEFSGKGIAEERVGTIGLHGAMEGSPARR